MDYRACRQRNDNGGTAFTNWIRQQEGLESHRKSGYVAIDVDLVWYNYLKAMLMLLELKEHMGKAQRSQETIEFALHQMLSFASKNPNCTLDSLHQHIPPRITYCGYHLVQFENTSPEDGRIYVDGKEVSKEQFMKFLQFEWTPVVQCYRKELEMIRAAYSRPRLDEIAAYIKQTTRMNHPEMPLLRSNWQKQAKSVEQTTTMFSDDDEVEDYYLDDEMEEAEMILQERAHNQLLEDYDV